MPYAHNVEGPVKVVTMEEVKKALGDTQNGTAAGSSGIVVEEFKALEEEGILKLTGLLNNIISEETIRDEWKESTITQI